MSESESADENDYEVRRKRKSENKENNQARRSNSERKNKPGGKDTRK